MLSAGSTCGGSVPRFQFRVTGFSLGTGVAVTTLFHFDDLGLDDGLDLDSRFDDLGYFSLDLNDLGLDDLDFFSTTTVLGWQAAKTSVEMTTTAKIHIHFFFNMFSSIEIC